MRPFAGYVGQIIEAAHEEDNRRRGNNEWVREHNDQNAFEQVRDWFFGGQSGPAQTPDPPRFSLRRPLSWAPGKPAPGGRVRRGLPRPGQLTCAPSRPVHAAWTTAWQRNWAPWPGKAPKTVNNVHGLVRQS